MAPRLFVQALLAVMLSFQAVNAGDNDWFYTKSQEAWGKLPGSHHCISKKRQSPLVIAADAGVFDAEVYKPLAFHDYDGKPTAVPLINTGNTAKLNLEGKSNASISVPFIKNRKFLLSSLHLHWSSDDSKPGSEHRIEGQHCVAEYLTVPEPFSVFIKIHELELHIIHIADKYQGKESTGLSKTDGVVVLAICFQKAASDNPNLKWFLDGLSAIGAVGASTTVSLDASIRTLIPANVSRYYYYAGSLTAPPCSETVQWFVFNDPMFISTTQINTLRNSLRKDDNGIMVDNIRPAFSAASWGADIKLYRNFHSAASVTYPAAHVTAYIMMLVVLLLFHFN